MHEDIELAIQTWAELNAVEYQYRVTIGTGGSEVSALVHVDTLRQSTTSSSPEYHPHTVPELFSMIIYAKYQLDDLKPARSLYLFDARYGIPLLVRQGDSNHSECPDFSDLANDDCDYYRMRISDFKALRRSP